MLLRVVAQSLKPVKLFSQQLPTFLLFRDRRSVAQQCWIRLHNSSNIVGATHAHYAWFTKTYGLYPSHDALQVPHHYQHARSLTRSKRALSISPIQSTLHSLFAISVDLKKLSLRKQKCQINKSSVFRRKAPSEPRLKLQA